MRSVSAISTRLRAFALDAYRLQEAKSFSTDRAIHIALGQLFATLSSFEWALQMVAIGSPFQGWIFSSVLSQGVALGSG
jgi:hypothetical protein